MTYPKTYVSSFDSELTGSMRNPLTPPIFFRPWADQHGRHDHVDSRVYALYFAKVAYATLRNPGFYLSSHMTQLVLKCIWGVSDTAEMRSHASLCLSIV